MVGEHVTVHDLAVGGEGVGRLADGRVAFIAGAAPGDVVEFIELESKKRHVRGRIGSVIEASPARVEPSCEAVSRGCGGCDWQHLRNDLRPSFLTAMVDDVLRRQGRVDGATSSHGGSVPGWGYRSTIRLSVSDGRVGYKRGRSNDHIDVSACPISAEPFADLFDLDWQGVAELTARVGLRTGERLVVVDPTRPGSLAVPDDVRIVGVDELKAGKRAWFHERANDREWRISAESFFQSGPHAAELLVRTVGRLVTDELAVASKVADLYGGVGLFAGSLAGSGSRGNSAQHWTVVESGASAVADARVNLDGLPAHVIRSDVERWRPSPMDLVIADPPRSGLRKAGCDVVTATGASTVVLVTCDLGSLGRDVALMVDRGYRWRTSVVLDLFPQTSHAEVVSVLDRQTAGHPL